MKKLALKLASQPGEQLTPFRRRVPEPSSCWLLPCPQPTIRQAHRAKRTLNARFRPSEPGYHCGAETCYFAPEYVLVRTGRALLPRVFISTYVNSKIAKSGICRNLFHCWRLADGFAVRIECIRRFCTSRSPEDLLFRHNHCQWDCLHEHREPASCRGCAVLCLSSR